MLSVAPSSTPPSNCVVVELRQPEGPPSGASYPYRKLKETHELSFSWLSWLAVLLVGAYARRDGDGDDGGVAQDGGHTPNNRLTETCSLGFPSTF